MQKKRVTTTTHKIHQIKREVRGRERKKKLHKAPKQNACSVRRAKENGIQTKGKKVQSNAPAHTENQTRLNRLMEDEKKNDSTKYRENCIPYLRK